MSLWSLLSTLILGRGSALLLLVYLFRLSVRLWHKTQLWDLQHCSTDLTGKTAVVTGANSGECSFYPITSLGVSAPTVFIGRAGARNSTHCQHLCPSPLLLYPLVTSQTRTTLKLSSHRYWKGCVPGAGLPWGPGDPCLP